ncbi:TPA: helix-turn-helix transcriptional regulator [Bacillus cereus]|uniref:helix-turn-helix domain-containing protein n=1 Tax=Bacillus wiedmannii TaxID=1890302 RepID=UPI001C01ADC6|nr:helix-turn-helix transcriptional regulator [Bacillus wiedmannii]QWI14811.1 XRE family transcriptional regulator [Bacillus wiedmannii]HDR8475352.1 helix-turn-helix transcriptional regulator [Bacillus cereus]
MKPDKKDVGKRIKQIKENYNPPISLKDFGDLLIDEKGKSISKGTVDSWMRGLGIPSKSTIEQIARLGNTTVSWIYWGGLKNFILSYLKEKNYENFIETYPETIDLLVKLFQDAGFNDENLPQLNHVEKYFDNIHHKKFQQYIEFVVEPYTSQIPNYLFEGFAYEGPKEVQQQKFRDLVKLEVFRKSKDTPITWGDDEKIKSIAKEQFDRWVRQYDKNKKFEEKENNTIMNYLIEHTKDEEGVKQILSDISSNKKFSLNYDTKLADEIVKAFLELGEKLQELDKQTELRDKKQTFMKRSIDKFKGLL